MRTRTFPPSLVRLVPSPLQILALVIALASMTSVGCVSKGKYTDLQQERDAVVLERDSIAAERDAIASEQEGLEMKLASVLAENEAMKSTYGELVRELQSEVEMGQITIKEVVDGIQLGVSDELLFPSGGTKLEEKGQALIARVASRIQKDQGVVSVEGHTDDVPVGKTLSARYPTNWELAGARAAVVTRVLSENGVDPKRLRAVSRGPFAPLVPNDSPENRARNRRTEIILRPVPPNLTPQ